MDGRGNDQQELSLTIKYLLENPALLQPPDTNNSEKCKDDKTYDQNQQNDLTSAYLGPQIWSDMLLSDDLKLEPVDLDELLDTTGLEDEVGDLSSLMASPRPRSSPHNGQRCASDDSTQAQYQDMPSLMSTHRSPDSKEVPSPSLYFQYPTTPRPSAEKKKDQQLCPNGQSVRAPQQLSDMDMSRTQKLAEMQLFDQQFAILNDILANNQFESSVNPPNAPMQQQLTVPPTQNPSYSPNPQFSLTSQQQLPKGPTQPPTYNGASFPSPTSQPPSLLSLPESKKPSPDANSTGPAGFSPPAPSVSPIEIRIPSPKRVAYVPNTTDVIISTPQNSVSETPFDPSTRAFTEEELKPQPIIRKSKKVHVSADNKDGKYWTRRNKNNVAAKRSREARRIKENQIAMRANYLEQENVALKSEITELRKELTKVVELVKKYEKRYATP